MFLEDKRDKKQCPVLTMAVSHLFPFEVTAPQRRLCSSEGGAGIWHIVGR